MQYSSICAEASSQFSIISLPHRLLSYYPVKVIILFIGPDRKKKPQATIAISFNLEYW